MRNIVAFADEFGNNSFEFSTQGSHFIVASVIVPKAELEKTEATVEEIRKMHFQTGEMKSKKVGPDHHRRKKILDQLMECNFSIYAVVVDKTKLFTEGFRHKKSFYKFLNGLVYQELFKTFPDLKLAVDEHGSNDFMRGFKKYVETNYIPTLFDGAEFRFISSPDNVLIQLADFIAGTLGYCFDENKKSKESKVLLEILRPKISSIFHFPPAIRNYKIDSEADDAKYNATIAEASLNNARAFISKKKVEDQYDIDQINCVKLLLMYFTFYNSNKYISTKELLQHLNTGREDELKEHQFRTRVIAQLRDKGVLISSNSASNKSGYKIPSSIEDLHSYVAHGNSMIIPLLSRIKKSRESIKLATHNKVDILDKPTFKELKKLIDNF
jgi:hypothetical protein